MNKEIYFSVDIEADGPIPGRYSMLSVGCAACHLDSGIIDTFLRNLELLSGAIQDEDTMKWWRKHPDAYAETRENPVSPTRAMLDFYNWVHLVSNKYAGKPVMVAYPAGFDFTFTHWYFMRFALNDPFGFQCIDMKTYAMALLKKPFKETTKKNMPVGWVPRSELPHNALEYACVTIPLK